MTQCERVLAYMEANGGITTKQAFDDLGITRLASRIHDLSASHDIKRETIKVKNRYGETVRCTRYSLKR